MPDNTGTPETYFIAKLDAFLKELQKEMDEINAKVGVVVTAIEQIDGEKHAQMIAFSGMKNHQRLAIKSLLTQVIEDNLL